MSYSPTRNRPVQASPEHRRPSLPSDFFGFPPPHTRSGSLFGLLSAELWRNPDVRLDARAVAAARRPGDRTIPADYTGAQANDSATAAAYAMREEAARQIHRKENRWPALIKEADRRRSILDDSVGLIDVADNPDADASTPWYSVHDNGYYGVARNYARVQREAERLGVDPDLVRAIMYVEYANGYGYGGPAQWLEQANSLYPMNIRPGIWQGLTGPDADFNDSDVNVRAGTLLLKRITDRLTDHNIAKIATLYNSLSKDAVTDYGAQVAQAYNDKLWRHKPSTRGDAPRRDQQ